jgi:hypothetical protein
MDFLGLCVAPRARSHTSLCIAQDFKLPIASAESAWRSGETPSELNARRWLSGRAQIPGRREAEANVLRLWR